MVKGRDPTPSASTAVCNDDQMDTDVSALHVQVSMAQRNIRYLQPGPAWWVRSKQVSDDNILYEQLDVSDMSAFQNSFNY